MRIKICYFARIREQLGVSDEQLDVPDGCNTIDGVVQHLQARDETWQQVLSSEQKVLKALNHEVLSDDHEIKEGDELAFFPPVTGG